MNEWINEDITPYNKMKAERDTLIDDIAVVRANNKRLEEELKRRREETDNLEAKLSAQLSMKKDLEKENTQLKESINKAEELIEGNIETLKMYGGIISKNYELEKENETFLKTMDLQVDKINKLKEENEQLKEKIDTSQVSRLIAENERQNEIIEKYREQNIELRNDLGQLKQELEDFHYTRLKHKEIEQQITALKQKNKALRLQANTYFDEWQESEKQRNEFISYVNLYTTLTNHIRMKAEANPGVSRYIDLVNYIDRLERD